MNPLALPGPELHQRNVERRDPAGVRKGPDAGESFGEATALYLVMEQGTAELDPVEITPLED
jgi:hypothetical protein